MRLETRKNRNRVMLSLMFDSLTNLSSEPILFNGKVDSFDCIWRRQNVLKCLPTIILKEPRDRGQVY